MKKLIRQIWGKGSNFVGRELLGFVEAEICKVTDHKHNSQ